MSRLPQVSGDAVIRVLRGLGYVVVRQRGSHAQLAISLPNGEHRVTVPRHRVIAKGTLHDILTSVSNATGISREELIARL